MKTGLQLKTTQGLALTPQLQQSIKLLQLSGLELEQEVAQMLQDNPFLEREEETLSPEETLQLEREQAERQQAEERQEEWGDELHAPDDWGGDASVDEPVLAAEWGEDAALSAGSSNSSTGAGDDDFDPINLRRAHEGLPAHLHRQALALRLNEGERAALYFLIESLNDDGYLEESLVSLAQALAPDDFEQQDEVLAHLKVALKLLQNFDPAGVGARDLTECLKLQLRQQPASAQRDWALDAAAHHLQALAKKDTKTLCAAYGVDEGAARAIMQRIARLDPKPGRRFAALERHIIKPEVIVKAKGRGRSTEFVVQINPEVMPRLRVHSLYAQALKNAPAGSAQQSLQEAKHFVKSIDQRFDTILRTAQAIVARQREFFLQGAVAMQPLVLREIAQELGLHESTISRVTTAKYMATPQGTLEMKYFFSSSLGTQGGADASSTAVQARIKQLIEAEDKAVPLSDGSIADALAAQGIHCARRTVAKYREGMRIAVASARKAVRDS